ncbi:hypothetical protein MTQ13_16290 [Streptomyces sp. XM4011]|uniref:hypothetical protein n=1 Tax=Streptomyces sp. XM4011 TaxID=2929780 RepID=UPI001FF76C8A|nr:hypothetical protein [Streptomyces sp. XM4011]MCK1815821.1 hypothetical protein [Streptomyces sp. XM4011]
MDALWWIVLLVIAGVALVAALVDGTARLGAGGSGRARRRWPWSRRDDRDDRDDHDGPGDRGDGGGRD